MGRDQVIDVGKQLVLDPPDILLTNEIHERLMDFASKVFGKPFEPDAIIGC